MKSISYQTFTNILRLADIEFLPADEDMILVAGSEHVIVTFTFKKNKLVSFTDDKYHLLHDVRKVEASYNKIVIVDGEEEHVIIL